ncbi:MAG: oxidoreductase [Planctomycetota bacterium]|nr:MAG: oxidoreductase [Planctomycetota bacterium]
MTTASPLDLREFIVKEHVGVLKLADTFDIFDAQTQAKVGLAKETPGGLIHFLRFLINKQMLPNQVTVRQGDENGPVLFTIDKPFSFFRSKVVIHDASGQALGYFKSKFFSLGGGFWVHDMKDQTVAEIKGDWKGWNFKFLNPQGGEIGLVTKKWGGLAKELFTSADTYAVSIAEAGSEDRTTRILLIAAALAIDIVYKEKG